MYAVPIYDLEGNMEVFSSTTSWDALNILLMKCAWGNGYSYIIGSDGTIYSTNRDYIMDQRNAFVEIETNGELKNGA